MQLIDLFSGIGGFSLAAHWMGWETIAFVERDEFCQKVLRKNFGKDIYLHDDITTFSGKPFRGRCDIITGGFPCQPFSVAGKRDSRKDERHLFPQMLRVISEVKPKFVVAENVRGLLSIESGQVFAEVVASLEGEGYEVITFCIPASAVNAPHRRDRLWIIAHADATRLARGNRSGIKCVERICTAPTEADISKIKSATSVFGGVTSDSAKQGFSLTGFEGFGQLQTQKGKRLHDRFELDNSKSFTDSEIFNERGLSGRKETANTGNQKRSSDVWRESWYDVALRTCVRGMDARLPDRLHIVGSRDNRTNRLKSLGNSICPQIAFEIFKAIEQTEITFNYD